jgi:glycosyltransferase involved in cell wall biosynthesis
MRRLPPLLWLKTLGSLKIRRDNLDFFWGTNLFLPWLEKNVKTVLTVHDLCPLLYPADYKWLHRLANLLFVKKDIAGAHQIVTVSRSTAERLHNQLDRRSVVAPPALRPHFRRPEPQIIYNCLARYRIVPPYLLSVATWEPRKNHMTLFKAFRSLKRQGHLSDFKLVLCGKLNDFSRQVLDSINMDQDVTILNLGYVPDKDLPMLYAGARLFVFPSKYEGFGMPVLEARACGTRVVTTELPELREAGGDKTIYTLPDTQSLAAGILQGLALPVPPAEGAGLPDWDESAKKMAAIFSNS